MPRLRSLLLLSLSFLAGLNQTSGAESPQIDSLVASWLSAQTNVQSWSADFVQTRKLKALAEPLTATGHVWFAAPNRFRWELGHPAQTIAVRAPSEMLIIYPRLKRVEHFPLTGDQAGQWRDALALLEAGFPRSQAELVAQYDILSQTTSGQTCELALQPRSAAARKMMPQIGIVIDTQDRVLRGTELQFADGSIMRNDFTNAIMNPKLEESLFAPDIPPDYKNVRPLKGKK